MEAIARPSADKSTGGNVVFVIDELDRCRPDYALAMLEVIKNFFTVPHLHFVLGVNLAALEAIVRTRYGKKIGARTYLGKFIQVKLTLPDAVGPDHDRKKTTLAHFDQLMKTRRARISFRDGLRS